MNKKKFINTIINFFVLFFIIFIFIYPNDSMDAGKIGLLIWINTIFPSMFPFIILTNLLMDFQFPQVLSKIFDPVFRKIFNISGYGAFPLLFGILGGYPLGAKLSSNLYERNFIDRREFSILIRMVNLPGPLFLIGTIALHIYHNLQLGYFLIAIHFLSSISTVLIFNLVENKKNVLIHQNTSADSSRSLSESINYGVYDGMEILLLFGGLLAFFSLFTLMIEVSGLLEFFSQCCYRILDVLSLPYDEILVKGLLIGLIESINGSYIISQSSAPVIVKLIFTNFILAFSGLTVLFQSMIFLHKHQISFFSFLKYKIIQSLITIFFTLLFSIFINQLILAQTVSFSTHFFNQYDAKTNIFTIVILTALIIVLSILKNYLNKKSNQRFR